MFLQFSFTTSSFDRHVGTIRYGKNLISRDFLCESAYMFAQKLTTYPQTINLSTKNNF